MPRDISEKGALRGLILIRLRAVEEEKTHLLTELFGSLVSLVFALFSHFLIGVRKIFLLTSEKSFLCK